MSGQFHNDGSGFDGRDVTEPMNQDRSDHDQAVAERFQLLDRVPAPTVQDITSFTPAAPAPVISLAERRWPLYAVASAAALIMVAGLSFAALQSGEDDQGVEAISLDDAAGGDRDSEAAERSDGSDDVSDGDRSELTVSVPDSERSDDGDDGPGSDGDDQDLREEDSDDDTESRGDGDREDEGSERTTTIERPDDERTETTRPDEDDERPDPTTAPTDPEGSTTESPIRTMPPEREPSTTNPGDEGGDRDTVTIRGVLTVLATDCESRLVLNDNDEVESVGPVSCDGGSFILVDGVRIQTSAGFVAAEDYYDRHPTDLQPGSRVVVEAVEHDGGRLSLDCSRCSVRRG